MVKTEDTTKLDVGKPVNRQVTWQVWSRVNESVDKWVQWKVYRLVQRRQIEEQVRGRVGVQVYDRLEKERL